MRKIAVIGGGASGIIAALRASCEETQVDIYEKNSSLGKKISISGNGRCNISNIDLSEDNYFTNNKHFVNNIFKSFGYEDFERFFEDMGVVLKKEQDGKVFPFSYSAKSLLKILEANLREKGVNIYLQKCVKDVKKCDNGFMIFTDKEKIYYDKILLCNGSLAAKHLGGTTSGYEIAKSFSHNIVFIHPSLVQLKSDQKSCSMMSGVKTNALIKLLDETDLVTTKGDILFTKYGLSGFAILDISYHVCKKLKEQNEVVLSVNFMQDYSRQELFSLFKKIRDKHKDYTFIEMLGGFINLKIAKALLRELDLDSDKEISKADLKDFRKIANQLLDWRFVVKSSRGFEYAEVCAGGVDTFEVDHKTMESKLVKGLYFAGELLDVTGKRGGYNLAFAWSSGYIAGNALRRGL